LRVRAAAWIAVFGAVVAVADRLARGRWRR
jgi:hypothetical protein